MEELYLSSIFTTYLVVFVKLDKTVSPVKKILYNIIFLHQILMNIVNIIDYNRIIIYTKIINITSRSIFFILSTDQSFEMFLRHIGPTTTLGLLFQDLLLSVCKFLYH